MAHSADSLPLKLPSSLFPLGSGQLQVRRRPWASLLLTDTGNACRSPGMAPRLSPCFPLSLHPFGFCLRPVLGGGLFCPCQQKSGRAAAARHWTLDFDLSLSTRPGPLMVLVKYLKAAGPAPSFPPTSCPSPHTTTTLAPLPHDRLDPPSCQLVSILHHGPMDCVSKEGEGKGENN